MRVFATLLPRSTDDAGYQEASARGVYGASVAVSAFIKHLLAHGRFDEFHFFRPGGEAPAAPGEAERLLGLAAPNKRVRLRMISEYASTAHSAEYLVLHSPWGPRLAPWLYLRNRGGRMGVPVTGVTHSLSYQSLLSELLALVLTGPQAWDSIVCLEEPARVVVQGLLDHLARTVGGQGGMPTAYGGRLDSIPLGVDTRAYRPRAKEHVRDQLGLPVGRLVVLWVGRFSPYDKADLRPLLLAFKIACNSAASNGPVLVLAGEDSRYQYAKTVQELADRLRIGQQVVVRKNLAMIEVPLLYSASDIFVAPSDNVQETFGQTVLEAMASGVPVICADWEGYAVSVLHGKTGLRVPTYWMRCDSAISDLSPVTPWRLTHLALGQSICVDVRCLAEAISLLLRNPGLRSRWGEEGRRHAQATYDWRVIIRRYEDLWDELHAIAVSNRTEAQTNRAWEWQRLAYFDTFAHYATTALHASTRVRATLAGDGAAMGPTGLEPYEETAGTLNSAALEAILADASDWTTIGALEEHALRAVGASAEQFRRQLLWLLKNDFLMIDVSTAGAAVQSLVRGMGV